MTAVVVIPARWGSTRFPGKPLAPLGGRPVIEWVYRRAARARGIDRVLVATDDERIRSAVAGFGGEAVLTRPDHPSGTDRIAEAMKGRAGEVVINVQGDEPLIDPELIERLAAVMQDAGRWDMATAATPIRDAEELRKPSVVKVVWNRDGQALYFSRSVIPFDRDGRLAVTDLPWWRHLGIYAYQRTFLERLVACPPCRLEEAEKLEQLRALDLGGRIRVLETAGAGMSIDTPADREAAERWIRANKVTA